MSFGSSGKVYDGSQNASNNYSTKTNRRHSRRPHSQKYASNLSNANSEMNYNNNNNKNIYSNSNNNVYYETKDMTSPQKLEYLENNTKQVLDNALDNSSQIETIASDTMETLYYQRKQLQKVDEVLHESDCHLNQTQYMLNGMQSVFGQMTNWFRKAPIITTNTTITAATTTATTITTTNINNNDNNNNNNNEKLKTITKNNVDSNKKNTNDNNYKNNSNDMNSQQVLNEFNQHNEEYDKELNEKLDMLLCNVQRINVMATDINEELQNQNGLIDSIDNKMDKVSCKAKNQNFQMKRIS